jgi:hypothetical protein
VKKVAAFVAVTFLLGAAASPQTGHPPLSPSLNDAHELRVTDREIAPLPKRIDSVRLQQDALALANAANSIPSDIESVRKGMLPKDVLRKLKQIEKLSKQLRSELNP